MSEPETKRRLFRVSCVEYMVCDSADQAADFTCYAWEQILRDDGHLDFAVEELELDDDPDCADPPAYHFKKLSAQVIGTVSEFDQEEYQEQARLTRKRLREQKRIRTRPGVLTNPEKKRRRPVEEPTAPPTVTIEETAKMAVEWWFTEKRGELRVCPYWVYRMQELLESAKRAK